MGTANGLAKASLNDDNSLKFNHFRSTPEHPDSLIGKFVYALYEDEDGILWIGTQAGLHRY
ncbi:MAG: hypothetical protein GWN00_37900, partial [Aliifodinibius sp.]|nr:hypothetical protein [Fodinibius sp.]NIY30351.1 hypothetical protein [Fodinibius sp.]